MGVAQQVRLGSGQTDAVVEPFSKALDPGCFASAACWLDPVLGP